MTHPPLLPDPWATPSLDVAAVARALDLSPDAIYDGVNRGDIPSVRVGRAIRVPTAWLWESLRLPMPADPARAS